MALVGPECQIIVSISQDIRVRVPFTNRFFRFVFLKFISDQSQNPRKAIPEQKVNLGKMANFCFVLTLSVGGPSNGLFALYMIVEQRGSFAMKQIKNPNMDSIGYPFFYLFPKCRAKSGHLAIL
jgi:hypothetical protein